MARRKIKIMDVVKFISVALPAIQLLREMLKNDDDQTPKKQGNLERGYYG